MHRNLHLRRSSVEAHDRLVETRHGVGNQIVDDPDIERSNQAVANGAGLGAEFLKRGEQALARLIDELTLFG